MRIACVTGVVIVTLICAATVSDWRRTYEAVKTGRAVDLPSRFWMLAAPADDLDLLPAPRLRGLVTYLRECTTPGDRILTTWYAPEVHFFAKRGFAGGMLVFFRGHWSDDRDQRLIVERLKAQRVPIVIIQTAEHDEFRATYPLLSEYLEASYRVAGETDFWNPDIGPNGYRVLAYRDRTPVRTEPRWSMPCFQDAGRS